jgi:serine/threonine-protein kinase
MDRDRPPAPEGVVRDNPDRFRSQAAEQSGTLRPMDAPHEESMDPPEVGRVLEDRYRLLGMLGEGGIGWVYRAEHLKLGHEVAIKMLQPQYAQHTMMRPRFEREAKALAALSHPNIVSLTDYSVDEGWPYLVMELLGGRTMQELIEEGPVDPAIARHIAGQVLDALIYAHETGFVHRDLKPGNLFLVDLPTDPNHVKVLDFGFVKLIAEDTSGRPALTQSGIAFGTPSYMSPEQATGDSTDARTDIYAFGIVLFEMLAGRRPFVGNLPEIVRQHLTADVPSLTVGGHPFEASPELRALLERAMAKEKGDRFQTAAEMRDALDALREPLLVPAQVVSAAAETMPAIPRSASGVDKLVSRSSSRSSATPNVVVDEPLATPPRPSIEPDEAPRPGPPPRKRKRGSSGWLIGLGTVALCVVGAWYVWLRPRGSDIDLGALSQSFASAGREGDTAPVAPPAPTHRPPAGAPATMGGVLTEGAATPEAEEAVDLEGGAEDRGAGEEGMLDHAVTALGDAFDTLGDTAEGAVEPIVVGDPALAGEAEPAEAGDEDEEEGDEDEDAEEGDEPDNGIAAPDPWAARPPTGWMREGRLRVLEGHRLSDRTERALRTYVRRHREDMRGHLLLASHFALRDLEGAALERYELAQALDDGARGDPHMLDDLLRLSTAGSAQARARRAIVSIYGEEALPTIEAWLARPGIADEQSALLRALRTQITSPAPSTTVRRRARPTARRRGTVRRRARRSRRSRRGRRRRR